MRKIFNKFNLILNIWISLIINIVLSIVLPIVAMGMVNFSIFIRGFAIAFPVSTIVVLVVPITKLGDFIASKLGCKPRSILFTMVSTAVLSLLLGSFMSLLMTAVNAGPYTGLFTPAYFGAWFSAWGWALLSVYISALFGIWTGLPLTMKLCGPPAMAPEKN